MSKIDKKKLDQLKKEIQKHDYRYYVLAEPSISDYEYDQLFKKLQKWEAQNPRWRDPRSPTQRVPGAANDLKKAARKALKQKKRGKIIRPPRFSKKKTHQKSMLSSVLEKPARKAPKKKKKTAAVRPPRAFKKANHRKPMLSLENTYSVKEMELFAEKLLKSLKKKNVFFFCEPKMDGAAVELVYEKGRLVRALTRGDGKTGEDVLENIKTIKSVPLKLKSASPPEVFEARAEVVLFKKDFIQLNEKQKKSGQKIFSNPRNAAAGALRNLDSEITAGRSLKLFCHSPGVIQGASCQSHRAFVDMLKKYELPFLNYSSSSFSWNPKIHDLSRPLCLLHNSVSKIKEYYEKIQSIRMSLPFEIDGVVVKVNMFSDQKLLGMTGRNPKWAAAVKFPPEISETQVEDIFVQTGRTGIVVPVARMKPVFVGHVVVAQASLHNFNELEKKDVRAGDFVQIKRAGDVIPEIEKVVLSKRPKNTVKFKPPKKCSSCGQKLVKVEDHLYCLYSQCSGVLLRKLEHFCSKKAMNIESLGKQTVRLLFQKKWIQSFSDIYRLTQKQLADLEGFAEQSSKNIIESIQKSKTPSFSRFLFSLGVRHVGEHTSVKLEDFFGGGGKGFQKLLKADASALMQVDDVGEAAAQSLVQGLKSLKPELNQLFKLGVQIRAQKKQQASSPLKGLFFVITGVFEKPRTQLEQIILDHGGKVQSSVSRKTNYLLCGRSPGSKYGKAQKLQIPQLNWGQFKKLISGF